MSSSGIDIDLAKIADKAMLVSEMHADFRSAVEEEDGAKASLLTSVLNAVLPAAKALSSALTSSYWPTTERFAERGTLLAGEGPARRHPEANSGIYESSGLYLLSTGLLAEIHYYGTWTKWQGGTSWWKGYMVSMSPAEALQTSEVSAEVEVLDGSRELRTFYGGGYEIIDILETLSKKLAAQESGSLRKRAVEARANAEKFTAIARLLK